MKINTRIRSIFKNIFRITLRKILFYKANKFLKQNEPVFGGLFDYISFEIILDEYYEKSELDKLLEWISRYEENTGRFYFNKVIDVGANIGNHSRYFAKYFKNVIAIEAHPLTFKILEVNTAEFDNITLINLGVCDQESIMYMDKLGSNIGGIKLDKLKKNYTVKCNTLDNILKDESDIGLIKIDVEGFEYEVVRGAKSLLKNNSPIICFEQQKSDIELGTTKTIELLKELGYYNFLQYTKKYDLENKNDITKLILTIKIILFGNSYKLEKINKLNNKYHPLIIAYK